MASNELRERVREGRTFADAVDAFYQLLRQSDLSWSDLLDCLGHPGLIADAAAMRLHKALNVSPPESGPIRDRASWEQVLRERNVSITSHVG